MPLCVGVPGQRPGMSPPFYHESFRSRLGPPSSTGPVTLRSSLALALCLQVCRHAPPENSYPQLVESQSMECTDTDSQLFTIWPFTGEKKMSPTLEGQTRKHRPCVHLYVCAVAHMWRRGSPSTVWILGGQTWWHVPLHPQSYLAGPELEFSVYLYRVML